MSDLVSAPATNQPDARVARRQRVVTTTITEAWTHYCVWPGGPGCKSASEHGCCGEGGWRVIDTRVSDEATAE